MTPEHRVIAVRNFLETFTAMRVGSEYDGPVAADWSLGYGITVWPNLLGSEEAYVTFDFLEGVVSTHKERYAVRDGLTVEMALQVLVDVLAEESVYVGTKGV